jgi:hypothetical protein
LDDALLDETVLKVASSMVALSKKNRLWSSTATLEMSGSILVSVTALPLEEDEWEETAEEFCSARSDWAFEYPATWATDKNRENLAEIEGFVRLYLGIKPSGDLKAAIGVSGPFGRDPVKPRQFPDDPWRGTGGAVLGLTRLPPKYCDIDAEGELVLPGEGYLISAADVSENNAYWESRWVAGPAGALELLRETLRTDTSPWLVSGKHIGNFDIDKQEARERALSMWLRELQAVQLQAGESDCRPAVEVR